MGGGEVQILESVEKMSKFTVFLHFLGHFKQNEGSFVSEMCKREASISPGKFETISPGFPGKMTVFFSFGLTFPPVPP